MVACSYVLEVHSQPLHPHLFQSRNYFFIELEYVECGTLFEVQEAMPKHRFPIADARFFCAEVASALGHIHERGVIYRDLKPENVMVDAGECPL